MPHQMVVPSSLRRWFLAHFLIDMVFAIPLLLAPVWLLHQFGWTTVEPFTARLAGAALLGIGGVSLWQRNAGRESYISLLCLKIIWSWSAIFGIALSIRDGAPRFAWVVFTIFVVFAIVWLYYYRRLRKSA